MTTLIAKVKNGRIDLPPLPEFPEGTDVSVTLRPVAEPLPAAGKLLGYASDEEYGTDPESIEKWIADFKALERPDFTDEDWDEMRRQRAEYRAWCAAEALAKEARRQAGQP